MGVTNCVGTGSYFGRRLQSRLDGTDSPHTRTQQHKPKQLNLGSADPALSESAAWSELALAK